MRASPAFEPRVLGSALVPQYLERFRTGDRDTIANLIALDGIIGHAPSVNNRLGIIGPASHADVDASLDIRAKSRYGIVMHAGA